MRHRNATGQPNRSRQSLIRSDRHHNNTAASRPTGTHQPADSPTCDLPLMTSGKRDPERHRTTPVLINHLTSTRSVRYTLTSRQTHKYAYPSAVASPAIIPLVHPPQMLSRTVSALGQKLTERAVLRTIRKHPGLRLFEINDLTLQSHHSWGTKSVVQNLERQGKITVVRNRLTYDRKTNTFERKAIKPLYFAC